MSIIKLLEQLKTLLKKTKKPLRNCDVGTAEAQARRFSSYCEKHKQGGIHGVCSSQCPLIMCSSRVYCMAKWSQMVYEKGETK